MIHKGDFESARLKLIQALELEPNESFAHKTLSKVNEMLVLEHTQNLDEKIVEISNLKGSEGLNFQGNKMGSRCCNCNIF